MWKKLENFTSSRTDADLSQGTNADEFAENPTLEDPWLTGEQEPEKELESTPVPQASAKQPDNAGTAKPQLEKSAPVTLGAYTEAVKKFTKSASAFIEQLPLLAEARQAYEDATRASAELRRVLDSGDENLRALMSHLEQMANIQLVNVQDKKGSSLSEPSKLGPVRVADDSKSAMKRFP